MYEDIKTIVERLRKPDTVQTDLQDAAKVVKFSYDTKPVSAMMQNTKYDTNYMYRFMEDKAGRFSIYLEGFLSEPMPYLDLRIHLRNQYEGIRMHFVKESQFPTAIMCVKGNLLHIRDGTSICNAIDFLAEICCQLQILDIHIIFEEKDIRQKEAWLDDTLREFEWLLKEPKTDMHTITYQMM